jgi:hypothetical protein
MQTCCQDTHTMSLVVNRRLTQSSAPRPLATAGEFDGGEAGAPTWNRCAGVAIFSAWFGRVVF